MDDNYPADLQSLLDFLYWMSALAQLQAHGVVTNAPVVTGDKAKILHVIQLAAVRGLTPQTDEGTIRRVILDAARMSGMESPPPQKVEDLVFLMQQYQKTVDLRRESA